jgi:hypothetical protein
MKDIHVGVCVPSMGSIVTETTSCLLQLSAFFHQNRVPGCRSQKLSFIFAQGSLLPQVRQGAFASALKAGCTHILAIDSDMKFPKQVIHGLFKHDKDFVAANYVTKQIPAEPVTTGLDLERVYSTSDKHGLEVVSHTGFGVVLIKTKLVKRIGPALFEIRWNEESGAYMGEDVYFCERFREAGGKIYIDHDLSKHVTHLGKYEFSHAHYKPDLLHT